MATLTNNRIVYGSGETLPEVNSPEYNLAANDPTGYMNFKEASGNSPYTQEDEDQYQNAAKEATVISSSSGKNAVDKYVLEQRNDMNALSMNNTPAQGSQNSNTDMSEGRTRIFNTKTGTTSFAQSGANLGTDWVTAEEAQATGIQIPAQQQDGIDYNKEEKEINDTFNGFGATYDAATKAQVQAIKDMYASRIEDERAATARGKNTTANYLRSAGFGGMGVAGVLSGIEKSGLDRIKKLSLEENKLIAEANMANVDKKFSVFAAKRNELKEVRREKVAQINKLQDIALEERKYKREQLEKTQKEVGSILTDAAKNGAPADIQNKISRAQNLSEAVAAAGDYLQGGTGIVGEYNFYKKDALSRGLVPMGFDEYQTRDANRKISLASIQSGDGYTSAQQKIIRTINDSVSKNDTYKKTASMRTYADNILISLSQENGLADIAAINQFQKVIDEGAVTRDQDVKLIQSAQSLKDSFALRIDKLKSGEQLSPSQRKQMRTLVEQVYAAQTQALLKDPYISAKKKEAERAGVKVDETIIGELGGLVTSSNSTGQQIIQEEEQMKTKVEEAARGNPELSRSVFGLLSTPSVDNPDGTKRVMNYVEIFQYLQATGKIQ